MVWLSVCDLMAIYNVVCVSPTLWTVACLLLSRPPVILGCESGLSVSDQASRRLKRGLA